MQVTALTNNGNSSKFSVQTKRGDFVIALSFTLRTNIWKIGDAAAELKAAEELAEAIVSRHNPKLPFRNVYVFAEHNTLPTFQAAVQQIRKYGYERHHEETRR
jgi:hypothetical protein